MRRVLLAAALAGALVLGLAGSALGRSGPVRSCGRVHEPAFHAYVTRVRAARVSCRTARRVARSYVLATSSTTNIRTGRTRQGGCYPSAVFGLCGVPAGGTLWNCIHPHPTRRHPRPATRCQLGLSRKWVRFNWL